MDRRRENVAVRAVNAYGRTSPASNCVLVRVAPGTGLTGAIGPTMYAAVGAGYRPVARGGPIDTDLQRLIVVSAVVMGMAHTIARERIFMPLRERAGGSETWLGYLVSCPYCASHWIAFALVPLTGTYGIRILHSWGILSAAIDWFLSSILMTIVAAFLRVAFYFVDERQGLVRRQQRQIDVETILKEGERERRGR